MQNIGQVIQFVLNNLQIDCLCIQEINLLIIEELSKILQEGQNEVGNQLINSLVPFLDSNESTLLYKSLNSLSKVLSTSDILIDNLEFLLNKIISLYEIGINKSIIFDVLSNLVFSAGPSIINYSEQLYSFIFDAASCDETIDPKLKQNAIEALGNLLRFSGDLLSNVIDESIQLFLNSFEIDDYELKGSIIIALQNLIIIKCSYLENYINNIYNIIEYCFKLYFDTNTNQSEEDNNEEDEDDENNIQQKQIRLIQDCLLMIKNLFKYMPNLIPEDPILWKDNCLKIINSPFEDLQSSSILALTYIWIYFYKNNIFLNDFIEYLIVTIKDEKPLTKAMSFKAIVRILEQKINIDENIIEKGIESSLEELIKEENGQSEVTDSELSLNVNLYRFLAIVATYFSNLFPINQFLDHGKSVFHEGSSFLKSQYLGVLRQLYISNGKSFKAIYKNYIIKFFLDGLDSCDFSSIPESILALKNVLEIEPRLINENISEILNHIENLFNSEFDGELHYYSTITDSISLILTLFKVYPNLIDLDYYLPLILTFLPVKGDEIEAEFIYSTLLNLNNDFYNNYLELFLKSYLLTLNLNDEQLKIFKLKDETFNNLINRTKKLIEIYGDISNLIDVDLTKIIKRL